MRNSNFELLRLVSMFFIVFYHILFFIVTDVNDNVIYKAMWLPLHVAVICFVLVSGYFHIKPSLRGGVKLLFPLILFYVPLTIWDIVHGTGSIKSLLFLSKSPYWFIRTYLCLFLVSPVLNSYLTSNIRRVYLLVSLGFISIYMGTLHEPSLMTGKNLALFMFLYVLGDTLCANKSLYKKMDVRLLLLIYLLLNLMLVTGYIAYHESLVGKVLWGISYPYRSPVLILNATLLFVVFSKLELKSKSINYMASSVFAIYILHHQHYVLESIIRPIVLSWGRFLSAPFKMLILLSFVTLVIMAFCIFIDKIVDPIQLWLIKRADSLEKRLDKCFNKYDN